MSISKKIVLIVVLVLLNVGVWSCFFAEKNGHACRIARLITQTDKKCVSDNNQVPDRQTGDREVALKYPFDTKKFISGYQVGQILVFLDDMEYKFQQTYEDKTENRQDAEKWNKVAELVTNDAIMQNEGIKAGLYEASLSARLTPEKVNKARDYFKSKGTTYAEGETVALWFHNDPPPEQMSVDEARAKTEKEIKKIYAKLKADPAYTIEKAGQEIASNSDWKTIDIAYRSNAYVKLKDVKKGTAVFHDPKLEEAFWNLNKGAMSEILVGRDADAQGWYDAFFVIIKKTDQKGTEFNSLEEMIAARKGEGLTITLEKS